MARIMRRMFGRLGRTIKGVLKYGSAVAVGVFVLWHVVVPSFHNGSIGTNTQPQSNANLATAPQNGASQPAPPQSAAPPTPIISGTDPCLSYLGNDWPNRVKPGVVLYASFPSTAPLDEQMTQFASLATAGFGSSTIASWQQSTTPRYWTTSVDDELDCTPQPPVGQFVVVRVALHLTVVDTDNQSSLRFVVLDVYLSKLNSAYYLAAINATGSRISA